MNKVTPINEEIAIVNEIIGLVKRGNVGVKKFLKTIKGKETQDIKTFKALQRECKLRTSLIDNCYQYWRGNPALKKELKKMKSDCTKILTEFQKRRGGWLNTLQSSKYR